MFLKCFSETVLNILFIWIENRGLFTFKIILFCFEAFMEELPTPKPCLISVVEQVMLQTNVSRITPVWNISKQEIKQSKEVKEDPHDCALKSCNILETTCEFMYTKVYLREI